MHDDLDQLDAEIRTALLELTTTQTQATPTDHPEKWSIQQIVEHLIQTYSESCSVILTRLKKGHPTHAVLTPEQRVAQFFLITLGYFPRGRPAPAEVSPPESKVHLDGDDLAGRTHNELVQLDELTAAGDRLFGNARAATHIILGPLSMRQWRRFHLIHGRHHLKQVQTIRRNHRI